MRGASPLAERLALVVITDEAATGGIVEAAEAAIGAGAPCLQLRAKTLPTSALLAAGSRLRAITRDAGALLIVNDRVDVALAIAADGVQLGDDDLPLVAARRIVPPEFIIGRSVDDAEQARAARDAGADYVGVGPVFPTATKDDTGPVVGLSGVGEVRKVVQIPVVGIGGITRERAGDVIRAGADGVAVIGGVMFAAHPAAATDELLREIRRARDAVSARDR